MRVNTSNKWSRNLQIEYFDIAPQPNSKNKYFERTFSNFYIFRTEYFIQNNGNVNCIIYIFA